MSEEARLQAFTTTVLIVLLFATAVSNNLLLVGIAVALAVGGLLLLPSLRTRGTVAAIIGATVAELIVIVMRLGRLA